MDDKLREAERGAEQGNEYDRLVTELKRAGKTTYEYFCTQQEKLERTAKELIFAEIRLQGEWPLSLFARDTGRGFEAANLPAYYVREHHPGESPYFLILSPDGLFKHKGEFTLLSFVPRENLREPARFTDDFWAIQKAVQDRRVFEPEQE